MKRKKISLLAWILAGFCILSSLVQMGISLLNQDTPFSVDEWVNAIGWGFAIPAMFSLLAALIITHQPKSRVGWLMILPAFLLAVSPGVYIEKFIGPSSVLTPVIWLLFWFDGWSWILVIFPIFLIPLNFPDGSPPSPRWNWVNNLAMALWLFFMFISAFINGIGPVNADWTVPNPIGVIPVSVVEGPFLVLWGIGLLTIVGASVVSLFVRYHRAQPGERHQIKWLLYAGAVFVLTYGLVFFLADSSDEFGSFNWWVTLLFVLSILSIPAAITIAILRYRLFDIDIIIRKTLLYGVLTILLGLVYFGSVTLMQTLSTLLFGIQSSIIIVISTLAIAALFNPLRSRIQNDIDRRFFRQKYNAELALARFSIAAQNETDIECLNTALLDVVLETMQPEQVSLWLRPQGNQ